ncbi:MAG: uridine kinase [Bacteroidota bacterium]|nr:uridine kinase [Bacteroidota bacterium]
MLIIGITGGSGSGKTTVVNRVLKYFPAGAVGVVHMDSYYKDNSHLQPAQRALINFDHPDSVEFDLLYKHVLALKNGEAIDEPTYDFIASNRKKETIHITPVPVIIVEGILLFTDSRLRDLFNIKVFVDAEADERVIRIIQRDIQERGKKIEDVLERYEVVKNMYNQFIEPTKRFADIIIPQGGDNKVAIDMLVAIIRMQSLKDSQAPV